MSTEGAVRQITRRETRGSVLLWFGLLAAPAAWGVQLVANYSLEEWFACAPAVQDRGTILGVGIDTVAFVITTGLIVVALLGLITAIACYRKLGRGADDDSTRRARWMALAGVFNGILYTMIIVASYAVPLLLETCRTTP